MATDRSSKKWFEDYFDESYEKLYSKHLLPVEQTRNEAKAARRLLKLKKGERLLDIAAGFGRHARPLARSGINVVALDLNSGYVARAIETAKGQLVPRGVAADMRTLPFHDQAFRGAMILFNSFGYFGARESYEACRQTAESVVQRQVWKLPSVFYEKKLVSDNFGKFQPDPSSTGTSDSVITGGEAPAQHEFAEGVDQDQMVLNEAYRVLEPGCSLLIEMSNPAEVVAAARQNPRRHMIGHQFEMMEDFDYAQEAQVLYGRTTFVLPQATRTSEYWIRLYRFHQLQRMLRRAGFCSIIAYGNGEREPYNWRNSSGLWVLAQRGIK
jgi:ubiquinone/menaquinone biosynthesis C-methylase UbiE